MADRRHTVTQLDFFIRQVTLFADEIRNAVGQKLDVLGFKTTGRDLGEQMAFGFLLEFLQKVVVIVCDRFAGQRIQCLGKSPAWGNRVHMTGARSGPLFISSESCQSVG